MIIIVDKRELVLEGYRKSFKREGVAAAGFKPEEFQSWLKVTPDPELAAIEAVLLGGSGACETLPAEIRKRIRTPVIALSEMRSLNEILKLFSVGVDDVVRKPVHVREILARASAIMRRIGGDDGSIPAGDIRVFPDGRPPLVGGAPMQLPRREYRILHHLVMHRDRRVSKRQLFDSVYGLFEDSVEESVIESHISKLRKKLRRRLGYDPIDSRRYLGYCLSSRGGAAQGRKAAEMEVERPLKIA